MSVRVSLRVIPNSSKNVLMREGEELKLKITAPPVEGKANAFVIRYFSKRLKVAKSMIQIVRGEKSRHKVIELPFSEEQWKNLLERLLS